MSVSVRIPILWGDMDAFGHVNNTRYFTWFEAARIAYFERIGLSAERPDGMGPILATTSCDFLVPLAYPGDVEAHAWVEHIGRTSFRMRYEITVAGDRSAVCARGAGVVVLVDYDTGDKVPVPETMRAAMAALDGQEPAR